jgi:cholesterol transport system auxiliary component
MKKIFLSLLLMTGTLSACSMFSPVKIDPATSYMINTPPASVPQKRHARCGNLLVTKPDSSPIYNTTQMAYTDHPYQVGYYVKSRWAETPPQMLQALMILTLEKTHSFHSVGSPTSIAKYDYILNTQLLELQQDYTRSPHAVILKLRAQIVNAKTNNIIAAKDFSITEPLHQDNPYAGVIATNKAAALLLKQLTIFVQGSTC